MNEGQPNRGLLDACQAFVDDGARGGYTLHPLRLLLLGCLALQPVVQAADEIAEPVCEEKTVSVEQIPKGFVFDESTPAAGTRFWIGSSTNAAGTRFSLEQLRKFETDFQRFRRPEAVDPSVTVIRVYDADGKNYEERKVRFSALPWDFVLDTQRRSERTAPFLPGEAADAAMSLNLAAGQRYGPCE